MRDGNFLPIEHKHRVKIGLQNPLLCIEGMRLTRHGKKSFPQIAFGLVTQCDHMRNFDDIYYPKIGFSLTLITHTIIAPTSRGAPTF